MLEYVTRALKYRKNRAAPWYGLDRECRVLGGKFTSGRTQENDVRDIWQLSCGYWKRIRSLVVHWNS